MALLCGDLRNELQTIQILFELKREQILTFKNRGHSWKESGWLTSYLDLKFYSEYTILNIDLMTEAPSKTFTSIPLEEIRQDVNEDLPESREANSEVNENTIARPVLPSMMKKDYEELNLTLG